MIKKKYMGLVIVGIIILGIIIFINLHPVFGKNPDITNNTKIINSINFKNGKFQNTKSFDMNKTEDNFLQILVSFFFENLGNRAPNKILETKEFKKEELLENTFSWFGHSTILMNIDGQKIITDPIFYKPSPLPIGQEGFKYSNKLEIKNLPLIDVVIISHDHYDHLNYKTIKEIDSKVGTFLVPLGVKINLVSWGVDENKVYELDWNESKIIDNVEYIFTPSQHFSGRGLTNRFSTLWGSWVIKGESNNIYFSGDSGYFDGFKTIGGNYGPFDIAFIENGAYNENWENIHMYPEEGVQAGIDLNASILVPIHWGKFDLSIHSWDEPIERILKHKDLIKIKTPMIGEIFNTDFNETSNWWSK